MVFGRLFTEDFLREGVDASADWKALDETLAEKRDALRAIFNDFPAHTDPNEAETEERIVYKVTDVLGWTAKSVQQAVERGRREIPDALLFLDPEDRAMADEIRGPEKHRHADVILEAKRWNLPLDKAGGRDTPPSAQLLNYLSRAEVQSDGRILWGVLTNGRIWRLYWRRAKSLLTDYFEIDLAAALGVMDADDLFGPQSDEDRERDLKLFLLFFSRDAFDASKRTPAQTFHTYALEQGRFWETKVTERLREVVFDTVYPGFIRALKDADKDAPDPLTPDYLDTLREATFTFLYRLLFTLYAEDRDLLPKSHERYDDYSLSKQVRDEVARQRDTDDALSARIGRLYRAACETFRLIDEGDTSVGVPPYNGGLFSPERAPLLERVEIPDSVFAPLLDALSRTEKDGKRVRVSYRDLSVRELGSIYERLLEYEAVADANADSGIAIRLNPFARKGSGSYYTPDELVELIVARTLDPLVQERIDAFCERAEALKTERKPLIEKIEELYAFDPASAILDLKVCDPAMGSGHFLVSLVDYLADKVFEATQTARDAVAEWDNPDADYQSKVLKGAGQVRERILAHAEEEDWIIRPGHVSDEAIVRRMVLKRCVYGVDKNPMAVELAKVGLWLHTLTAGAPLSFLDHHLRCGDSLFGETVRDVRDEIGTKGALFLTTPLRAAEGAVKFLAKIEQLTDADMDEAKESAAYFADVRERTEPLSGFFSFVHALKWLDLSADEKRAVDALLDGQFGDTLRVASGTDAPRAPAGVTEDQLELIAAEPVEEDQPALLPDAAPASVRDYIAIRSVLAKVKRLVDDERFLHWELAFPGVWSDWSSAEPRGGFDAIVGNPPWDRMKMQEVEWFAARKPDIARQARAADRKAAIADLFEAGDQLIDQYKVARKRSETAAKIGVKMGNYPLLGRGDVNIYSLFVERSLKLINSFGMSGLLVPVGICTDINAAPFFKYIASSKRLSNILVFENTGGWLFEDVHHEDKPTVFISGGQERSFEEIDYSVFIRSLSELQDPSRRFPVKASGFANVNPNTGTAALFRDRASGQMVSKIYDRAPVLVNRSGEEPVEAWPVCYATMFHMTNDSDKFWTRDTLEAEGAYPIEHGHWKMAQRGWLPLYEGKSIDAFNHRYASVTTSTTGVSGQGVAHPSAADDLASPTFAPTPRYWVEADDLEWPNPFDWSLSFRDTTNVNNERTAIFAIIPVCGAGNKIPLLKSKSKEASIFLCANGNCFLFDYVSRRKIQSRNINKYILEQLPVIRREDYDRRFGDKSAAEIVADHVLRLTYTAWDLEPFARDLGYEGDPFVWDETERRHLRARLDALYFHLYGVTDPDDVRYILSTFPIVERKDRAAFDRVYLTAELISWYMRALAAGDTEAVAPETELIRQAKARG